MSTQTDSRPNQWTTVPEWRGQRPLGDLSPMDGDRSGTKTPKWPLTCGGTCPRCAGTGRGQVTLPPCPRLSPPIRGTGGGTTPFPALNPLTHPWLADELERDEPNPATADLEVSHG